MIAEILDSASFASVIDYHYNKIERGVASPVNHSFDRDTALRMLHEPTFIRNAYKKPYKNEPLFHVVISPSKEDMTILSESKVLELACEYMERMGFSNQELQIYKHVDTEHPHFHIVCNRINLETLNKNEPSFEKLKSVEAMEQLSRKYGLRTAKEQGHEHSIENKEQAGAKKNLEEMIKEAMLQSASYEDFILNLSFKDVVLKESNMYKRRHNKAYTYHFKYKGRNKHISSSSVKPSLKSIRKSFDKLSTKEKIKRKATFVLNTYKGEILNPNMFAKLMMRMGVKVEYSRHKDNSIFGCSFVNVDTSEIIKASDVKLGWSFLKSQINDIHNNSDSLLDVTHQYASWINYKKDDVRKLYDWSDKEKRAALSTDHGHPSLMDFRKASIAKKQEYLYAYVMSCKSYRQVFEIGCSMKLISEKGIAVDMEMEGVKLSDLFGDSPFEKVQKLFETEPEQLDTKSKKHQPSSLHTFIQGYSRHGDHETLEEQQRRIRRELGL